MDPLNEASSVLNRITQNWLTLSECKLQGFVKHAKKMFATGEYPAIITNKFTWSDWFVEHPKSAFHVVPYSMSFVSQREIDRDPITFQKTTWR